MKPITQIIRLYLVLGCCLFTFQARAQSDSGTVQLDQLYAPNGPAFTILGIEPSSFEEPTSPQDFFFSLQSASDDFNKLPSSYYLSFSPFQWFNNSKPDTFKNWASNIVGKNIKRTLTLSLGIHDLMADSILPTRTQMGLGIKFSIFRGKIAKLTQERYESAQHALKLIEDSLAIVFDNDSILKEIKRAKDEAFSEGNNAQTIEWLEKEQIRKGQLIDSLNNIYEKQKSGFQEDLDFSDSRTGFQLDFASAIGMNFPEQQFSQGELFRAGAWLTGSYNPGPKWSFMGTSRMFFTPNEQYEVEPIQMADNLRLDLGARIIWQPKQELKISGEYLYRAVLNNQSIPNTYKLAMNLEYRVHKDKLLVLTLGRDFDRAFISDGNLIAALNLIFGFGKKTLI